MPPSCIWATSGRKGRLSIFAQEFGGPVMAVGAAEETKNDLFDGRGDAYCGMLNASYNFNLRSVPVYIPQMPIGLPEELAPQGRALRRRGSRWCWASVM